MKIIRIPAGIYAANCYIIYSENTRDGIVVDPGGDVDVILKHIEDKDLKINYILLTHGHGDHIGGVLELKLKLNIPVLIHEEDGEMLTDPTINLSSLMPMEPIEFKADKFVSDGDFIEFGDLKGEIIHTPGHTKGCICLKIQDNVITGDTLFQGSIGRTDLQGGDYNTIIDSIKGKILNLPDSTVVWPGHGAESTIEREKLFNPFLR